MNSMRNESEHITEPCSHWLAIEMEETYPHLVELGLNGFEIYQELSEGTIG